jgi:phosphoribosylanthranilate isomerase
VGIFVNAPPSEVARLLAECDLDLAQLSGDETPEDLAALRGRAFKAIRVTGPAAADGDARRFAIPGEGRTMPAMLLDAAAGAGQYGGTGQMADWQVAAALAARYHLLLAGGLNPENVAEAVRAVRPWGVDVASGVESSPGRKDPARIRAFIESAHRAATHLPECGTLTSADQRG